MQGEYELDDHAFISSPNMDALYVINTSLPTPGSLPSIIGRYALADEDGNSLGLLIQRVQIDGQWRLRLTTGPTVIAGEIDTVRSGRVLVETGDSNTATTYRKLTASLYGAKIDTQNLRVTAGGIGITDILSGDPLVVDLVTASLDTMKDIDGNTRNVFGVYIEYIDAEVYDYSTGTHTAKCWGIQTLLYK